MLSPAGTLEALSRTFLDSALDCIITMDATGQVQEFNPASERVFGFTRTEAVGKELAELIIPPRLRERHRQGLAHYVKTGGPRWRSCVANCLFADQTAKKTKP
jgi:PAS domain S-box-containing protein